MAYNQRMKLKFSKMHGLGNDFVVIDGMRQYVELTPETIRAWGDRHMGVGFDQLLLVEPPETPGADFRYRIFNADGGEVDREAGGRVVRGPGVEAGGGHEVSLLAPAHRWHVPQEVIWAGGRTP